MNKFLALSSFRKLVDSRSLATRTVQNDCNPGKNTQGKKVQSMRITLIGADNTISITDFVNAQNLSMRRELKLVKIQDVDAKTRRPVYKLMTNADYHEEELQKRKEKQESRSSNGNKGEKLLTISSKIGQHDLLTRLKNATKWLDKQHEVRVVITGDSDDKMQLSENIYSAVEANVKAHGKIVQKRVKGNTLRFQILPNVNNKNSDSQEKPEISKMLHEEKPL